MYGSDTGLPPTQPNIKKFDINIQNIIFIPGLNWLPRILELSKNGIANNINIAANIAITPNLYLVGASEGTISLYCHI